MRIKNMNNSQNGSNIIRSLGKTDIKITSIGQGVMQFAGGRGVFKFIYSSVSEQESNEIIKTAIDNGINWFDTAEAYGSGRSERQLATSLQAADIKDENAFYDALEEMGFEVKAKDLQVFYGGAKKGDWDVGIAMDVMRLAPKLDTIVLVSGDGDFSDLLEHAKSLGCRIEVAAFGKTTSHSLTEVTDFFIDLDKNKKYLLKKGN